MITGKKVVVLGATAALHYLYKTARQLGVYTIAADANPDAASFPLADEYVVIDIFDFDALEKLCTEKKVDGVIGFGLDVVVLAAARLAERLGLPGLSPDVALRGTNKGLMKKAFQGAGIPTPDFRVVDSIEQVREAIGIFGLPAVIKPTDNAAKRGITVIHDPGQDEAALAYALENSREGKAIIEQFVEGKLVFAPTFVGNGVCHAGVMDQVSTENLVQVRFDCPSALPEKVQDDIRRYARLCAECLQIPSGGLHTEMIVSDDGTPWLIETSPRTSYATVALSRHVYGFDPVGATIRIALGEPPEIPAYTLQGRAVLQHLQPPPGTVFHQDRAAGLKADDRMTELTFFIGDGGTVREFRTNVDRVAYFIGYHAGNEPIDAFADEMKAYLESELFLSAAR